VQHFVHIMRRNYDLTYIVHDNQIYGLTTGQASPTSQLGMKTKTTPWGLLKSRSIRLSMRFLGATYVARAFAGDIKHMTELIKGAIQHRGFALIDVFQPCVTFNSLNTYDWFRKRVYKLQDTEHSTHDTGNPDAALQKAQEDYKSNYEKVPIGLFYKADLPTYESQLPS